jgi:hypothetical protein
VFVYNPPFIGLPKKGNRYKHILIKFDKNFSWSTVLLAFASYGSDRNFEASYNLCRFKRLAWHSGAKIEIV